MRPRLLLAVLAAFVVSLPLAPTVRADQFRATAEPPPQLIGTWRLNVGKSKYSPGPPLRSETRVYTRSADGVKGVVSRVYSDGRAERFEYMANFGKEDRKSTRLNSSHSQISYAVFCLKKKK